MRPLNDYVIIKKRDASTTTSSGIIMTSATGDSDKAQVVAMSEGMNGFVVGDVCLVEWSKAIPIRDSSSAERELWAIKSTSIILVY